MIQTVGIIGLGALGMLFGERLIRGGAEVIVIADHDRAVRLIQQGAVVNGNPVSFDIRTPDQAQMVDLLIFATKFGGLASAMETAAPFIGPDTILLSVLNGIASEQVLSRRFGPEKVLYCTAQGMDAVHAGNSLTYSKAGSLTIGEADGCLSERLQAVTSFLNGTGVPAEAVTDIIRRQWGKLMLNVGINQVVMVYEGDYGTVRHPGEARDMMIAAMREVQTVAGKKGYPIPDEELWQWVALTDSLSERGKPSMRQDGEAHRKSEVELFAGTIIREAEKLNVDVPVNRELYRRILDMESRY
ncbi:MAG: ketopantoate reductase family protein [Clostridia bacterium]|nr:ketopantoate reductase family protein [Clostridia bacterium]